MPSFGDLFTDLRGDDRTMRVSYHPDRGAVVVSLWSGTLCRGSFRMPVDDVRKLTALLTEIETSVAAAAPTGPSPSAPVGSGPVAGTAVAGRTVRPAPAVDQTGDISGTHHRTALPILPAPRVA
ncbi:hypothetical protein U2F26_12325 [Micromonospora sp. 4G57]|uniref:DUF2470 domain-containing protein n=1 Tax=Micromonospora sicca TaxID=2202420 RepID=A0ABU5J635_9ACTN|nr:MULTISPECIES: hypothetical protein [unclassified Micromonospora]MDZ5443516.1 hypothetical protein [Micromonospora sp. 4G57]MDZ5487984.1 hypothetical protein [Micromonospora sp. 4G53]